MSIIPLYRVDTPHPQAQACAACSVRGQSLFGALDRAGLDYIHASIDSMAGCAARRSSTRWSR